MKVLLCALDTYSALSGLHRGQVCEVHDSPYVMCEHKRTMYFPIELSDEQWGRIKGVYESKDEILCYDKNGDKV